MVMIIILFGLLVLLAGAVLVISPTRFFGLFDQYVEKPGLYVLAILARLILGALLISQAGSSRYPFAIEIIGWIAIGAAIFLAVIGHERFKRLISWFLSRATALGRVAGIAAACFGAFLLHAFI